MTKQLTIVTPSDMHVHLRDQSGFPEEIFCQIVRWTAARFHYAVVMPNPFKPIIEVDDVIIYRQQILNAVNDCYDFTPLMTFMITNDTTPKMVKEMAKIGVVAGKLYPQGVTTNSTRGVSNIKVKADVYAAMEAEGLILSVHGELPGASWDNAEIEFIPTLDWIVGKFSDLCIVAEHLQTEKMLNTILSYPENVGATITPQHILLNSNMIFNNDGKVIHPENYCKPVPRFISDNAALLKAVISGNPRIFFGSDSAPHLSRAKLSPDPASGVLNSPIAIQLMVQLFERAGALDKINDFMGVFGPQFYNLPPTESTTILEKNNWKVPANCSGIVPMYSHNYIDWQIRKR